MTKEQYQAYLKKLNLKQIELSNSVGVSANTVARWNTAEDYPSWLEQYFKGLIAIQKLEKLRELFNVK